MDSFASLASFTCRDKLVMILRKLGARDLARASCVCKLWRDMASDDAIVRPAFMEPWKLKEINGIWRFAISQKIVRGDFVTSLAKKYFVQHTYIITSKNYVIHVNTNNNYLTSTTLFCEQCLFTFTLPKTFLKKVCLNSIKPCT
ncbi:F-box protein [Salix suchowensis]|nr:F-box protein [Salix suchowensis]